MAVTVVGILVLLFIPESKQHRNMRLAQVYADKLQPVLSADTRFREVKLGPYTGVDGSLMVAGMVNKEEDKDALKAIVTTSKPPVKVVYMLFTPSQVVNAQSAHATGSDAPSFTTKWTPRLKEHFIALEVTNTDTSCFRVAQTPIVLTSPGLMAHDELGYIPSDFTTEKDVVTPIVTLIGKGFGDNRGTADNGGQEPLVVMCPKQSKSIELRFGLDALEHMHNGTDGCECIVCSLQFNSTTIYRQKMKRNGNGDWSEE